MAPLSPLLVIFLCYIAPLTTFFLYTYFLIGKERLWGPFSISLFLTFSGSLILFLFFRKNFHFLSSNKKSDETDPFFKENFSKKELLEKDFLEEELASLTTIKENLEAQLDKKEIHIHDLKSELHDLKYELQTLLEVKNFEEKKEPPRLNPIEEFINFELSPEITTECQADLQLQHCLQLAKKITGAQVLSNSHSLFRDFPSESYALDLRRLFDLYQEAQNGPILVYSIKEGRVVFVNHSFENLAGWNKEKLVQDFEDLILEGREAFRKAILELLEYNESKATLLFQTKSGEKMPLYCHLGRISSGIFKNTAIVILYTPKFLN